ncbi:hypothetical protein EVAR_99297_1 [Eumeta japonica]|uniref:Uncharacterized protein n=1 Tax=Eumeta variegata TaxID=151549 RepID=A0A4C2A4U1_EUMVA|nr:hypothetical protein EVAR_99297_1 [Eumeta japonica]
MYTKQQHQTLTEEYGGGDPNVAYLPRSNLTTSLVLLKARHVIASGVCHRIHELLLAASDLQQAFVEEQENGRRWGAISRYGNKRNIPRWLAPDRVTFTGKPLQRGINAGAYLSGRVVTSDVNKIVSIKYLCFKTPMKQYIPFASEGAEGRTRVDCPADRPAAAGVAAAEEK